MAEGDTGLTTTYSVVSPPAGLVAFACGTVSWIPTFSQAGTYNVKFVGTNSLGAVTATLHIVVVLPVPGEPTDVSATDPSSTGFTLSWLAPAVYPQVVAGYTIYIQYAPNDTTDEIAHASYTVPANVLTFHFKTPIFGDFKV